MKEICNSSDCTGCMACVNVCTHGAILVKEDKEGFDRPVVDCNLCVDCGLCVKTCPINHLPEKNEPKEIYSGWSYDSTIRINSSSGGAFTEIARPVLDEGGVVFGCTLNDSLQAEHVYVESIEELSEKLSGSKYVQSKIRNTYQLVKDFLKQRRVVLFSGTPCQVAGLRNYLRKDYDNLITVDLICHGVPSPKIFEDYKLYIEHQEKMNLTDIKFRNKRKSWIFYNMLLTGNTIDGVEKKIYIGHYYKDPYIRGFLNDVFLRPSCSSCKFTTIERTSDFTIADWWGYQRYHGESRDFEQKGVSLIFANTNKATELFDNKISHGLCYRKRTKEEALKTNPSLRGSSVVDSKKREEFWKDYFGGGLESVMSKYMQQVNPELITNIKYHMKPSLFREMLIWGLYKLDGCLKRLHIKRIIK